MTNEVQFCYVCLKCICICSMTRNLNIIDQFCIFHNLNYQFMLLEQIIKQKVVASYVISYNNQNKEKIVITKFIARFSLFLSYMLFTICEFGCLLHVHTCIDNFEILLFSYINDFFLGFYCIDVIGSMYQKINTLQSIGLMWKSFLCSIVCHIF